ncbi:hypothetical protein HG530_006858 [Fusarium avenaceum]|nr:hypothetical protein HG530_006858 [Fusarium avenaceum]
MIYRIRETKVSADAEYISHAVPEKNNREDGRPDADTRVVRPAKPEERDGDGCSCTEHGVPETYLGLEAAFALRLSGSKCLAVYNRHKSKVDLSTEKHGDENDVGKTLIDADEDKPRCDKHSPLSPPPAYSRRRSNIRTHNSTDHGPAKASDSIQGEAPRLFEAVVHVRYRAARAYEWCGGGTASEEAKGDLGAEVGGEC